MFISFLFPYKIRNMEAPYLWILYKQISSFTPEQLILIGSMDYFKDPNYFRDKKRWELGQDYCKNNEYEIPTKEQLESYEKYTIDDSIFDDLEGELYKSSNLVWANLLTNNHDKLKFEIEKIVMKCLSKHKNIDAIITWCNIPSLNCVAKKYGIKVIHNEIGPLRKPDYFHTAYFDFSGVNGNTDCFSRYKSFIKEVEEKQLRLNILSRQELLDLFSKYDNKKSTFDSNFEVGAVLQVEDDSNMLAFANGLNNLLLINIINGVYDSESILIRKHPSGYFEYNGNLGVTDTSTNSVEFLQKCKRICTINSSVGLEAILHGKETYILGDCSFKFLANNIFNENVKQINDLELNYVLFAYLIPYELLFNYEYYLWRLSINSEVEVYKSHMEYYMKKKIDELNIQINEKDKQIDELNIDLSKKVSDLKRMNAEILAINSSIMDLHKEINLITQSKSWKLTRPCRFLGYIARGDRESIIRKLQPYIRKYGYNLYMKLPVSGNFKKQLKNIAFSRLGFIFSGISQYEVWKQDNICYEEIDKLKEKIDLLDNFIKKYDNEPIYFNKVEEPIVSIIIPVYSGLNDLRNCLKSIAVYANKEPNFEVILVDDCPNNQVIGEIPDSPGLKKMTNDENLGFLLTCNRGAEMAEGKYLCFLNSDTIVTEQWLSSMVQALEETCKAGMVGGMLLNRDGTIQDAGWCILRNGWGHPIGRGENPSNGAYTYRRETDCVTGACFIVYKEIFEKLQGFDVSYAPAFYEEFDLAYRIKENGYKVIYEPGCKVLHLGSSSYGAEKRDELSTRNHLKFVKRFGKILNHQPDFPNEEFILRHKLQDKPVILMIDLSIPHPDRHAGDVTMSKYVNLLLELGWHVVYAPFDGVANDIVSQNMENSGIELVRRPITIQQWLGRNGKFLKYVWISRPNIAEQIIDIVKNYTSAKIIYYTHDLHHLRLEREAVHNNNSNKLLEEARSVKLQEINVFSKVNHIISPNSDESEIIRKLVKNSLVSTILPYFYQEFEIRNLEAEHFSKVNDLLFVGGFPHLPNVDSALYTVNEIMPAVWKEYPEVRLILVGYAPPPEICSLANSRVIVTGQVPDLKVYFDSARVFLAPLRYGAGVKGKIIQAMQYGVPVLTTSIGIEGIENAKPGMNVMVSETSEGIIKEVLALLRDSEKCAKLSKNGADLIRESFSHSNAKNVIKSIFKNTN
jgi:GT2 family glycosyltransferase